jgi:CRP/FNR family transcriptional regulator, anaerobic regulatory protein
MLARMPRDHVQGREVDCAGCAASTRCWREPVTPGTGFLVRRVRPLEAGEMLLPEGAPFAGPYVVTSGCVGLTQLLENGTERIVGFRVPGDVIGLESCNQRVHKFGVQAVSSATVCRLHWSAGGINARGAAMLRILLVKASEQLEHAPPWAGLSSVERVRAFADDFARRTDQPLPMTRAQIGSYLGLAEETVVRAFAELRRTRRPRT